MEASDAAQSKKKRERTAKSRAAQAMKDQAVEDNIKDQEEAAVATGKYVPDVDSKVTSAATRASSSAASSVSMASGLAEATSKPDEKQLAADIADMRRNQLKMEAKFDSVMAMISALGARISGTVEKDTMLEKEKSGVQSMTISSSLSGVVAPVSIMQVGASQSSDGVAYNNTRCETDVRCALVGVGKTGFSGCAGRCEPAGSKDTVDSST
jgi:hypothetical protein